MTIDKGIFIKNVYYMLAYAFKELRMNNFEEIQGEEFDNINQLFAEILIKGISLQLKQGLHREYVIREESLYTLKGKMNLNGTINNLMQHKNLLVCNYDELSENNVFNQILKTTVFLLLSSNDLKSGQKEKLRKLMLFFNDVNSIDPSTVKWTTLRFDRNSRTYQMLIYICYFLINDMLLTTEQGKYKMYGFSDDNMNRLFEKFVLEYYKRSHPELNPNASYIQWNINENASTTSILPIMKTDIMLTKGDHTLIIDTKYYGQSMSSHYNKNEIHTNNLYQIHTYVSNCDTTHSGKVDGMLLYAKTDEDVVPNGQLEMHDGNTIYFRTLDLGVDFEKIKAQLETMIANLLEI